MGDSRTLSSLNDAPPEGPNASGVSKRIAFALAIVYVVWGSTYLAMRIAVRELPPFTMGGVRFILAGSLMIATSFFRGQPLPTKVQWWNASKVGFFLFVCSNGAVATAQRSVSSSLAAIVVATTPIAALLIGAAWKGTARPVAREWFGVLVGLSGVALLSFRGGVELHSMAGLVLALCPLTWAFGSLLGQKIDVARGMTGAGSQMVAGGAMMLVVSRACGEPVPTHVSTTVALVFFYLVVVGSYVGFSAYAYLLEHTRPSVAMSYAYVNPIVAVLLGMTLGHESVGIETMGSSLLVGAGVLVLTMRVPKG